jgi:hypothetical protein
MNLKNGFWVTITYWTFGVLKNVSRSISYDYGLNICTKMFSWVIFFDMESDTIDTKEDYFEFFWKS